MAVRLVRLTNGVLCCCWMYLGIQWLKAVARTWPENAPSNCWISATGELMRHGGAIRLTESRYGKRWNWWHAQHLSADGTLTEYNPAEKHARWFPPLLFRGQVTRWRP